MFHDAQDPTPPQKRIFQPQMSIVLTLKNSDLHIWKLRLRLGNWVVLTGKSLGYVQIWKGISVGKKCWAIVKA